MALCVTWHHGAGSVKISIMKSKYQRKHHSVAAAAKNNGVV